MIQAGDLIVAPPMMPDSRFQQSVIIIANHSHTGSAGFVLNRESQHTINDILPEVGLDANLPFPLYYGGPVKNSGIWLLHDPDWYTENTMMLSESWSVTSSIDMFHCFADGDTPRYFRFVHGMASWAPNQLEMELRGEYPWTKDASWLTVPSPTPEWVFEQDISELWENSTELAAKQAVDAWL